MKIFSPVRVPVTENDPLGALRAELLVNGDEKSEDNGKRVAEGKNADQEDLKFKYDLASSGLFSNEHTKVGKKVEDGIHRMNKINARKREGGQDVSSSMSTRVPKSATFHHGREKESKANKSAKGCGTVEEVG